MSFETSHDVLDESEVDDASLYETTPSSLPYFGADFDVAGLVRRMNDGDIIIPRFDPDESEGLTIEGFQRQRVWSHARMESFIESLLLGWPIPSIFLVVEPDGKYLVLDGQQRLSTLQSFYEGTHANGVEFKLNDVVEHLNGATFSTLTDESRRRLNNTFIQAVVIEPDGDDGRDAVYRLFGRLNSGGVSLTAQEIRVALYRGKLVNLIRKLNHDSSWRRLFGPIHNKLKDHELILRAIAMSDVVAASAKQWQRNEMNHEAYKPPMAQFLNSYLEKNGAMGDHDEKDLTKAFKSSCQLLVEANGKDGLKFQGRLNAAHVDAILGNLIHLYLSKEDSTVKSLKKAIDSLRNDEQYFSWISRSTSHRDSVYGRLQIAYRALRA